ncbi:MAG: M23 family metallopeptidase [Bacteroidota bacterium]|nr:M23 family metallopeptidase [Bacteroidota bacterium]
MSKYKYKFNRETLSFEKIEHNISELLFKKIVPIVLTSAVIGIFVFILVSPYITSPVVAKKQDRLNNLKFNYQILNDDLETTSQNLDELQSKDDELYRVIYGIESLSDAKRNVGIGGSEKYRTLDSYMNANLLIFAHSKLEENMRRMVVQSESYNEIAEIVANKDKMAACIPAIQPIAIKDLTRFGSAFGMRFHPIHHVMKMHTGIDLTAPTGTKIYAPGDGVVFRTGRAGGYGNHVRINHGYGYVTVYGHLSKILVRPGQKVKRGDVIGLVGNTGLSTAPHLHYEVRINGKWVNPLNFYFNDLTDDEYEEMIKSSETANTHVFE